jgi:hypothetical protein
LGTGHRRIAASSGDWLYESTGALNPWPSYLPWFIQAWGAVDAPNFLGTEF